MSIKNQYHPIVKRLLDDGYFVRPMDYFREGFSLIRPFLPAFFIFSSMYLGITLVSLRLPVIGSWVQAFISGPFFAGLFLAFLQIDKQKALHMNTFLGGFYMFLPVLLANLLTSLLTTIGLLLLVIPGLYFFISYLFVMPLVVFEKMDFWSAMETSRMVVQRQFWQITSIAFMIIGINLLGALLYGMGLIITIPVTYAAIYKAYRDIFSDFDEEEASLRNDDNEEDDNTLKLSHFR